MNCPMIACNTDEVMSVVLRVCFLPVSKLWPPLCLFVFPAPSIHWCVYHPVTFPFVYPVMFCFICPVTILSFPRPPPVCCCLPAIYESVPLYTTISRSNLICSLISQSSTVHSSICCCLYHDLSVSVIFSTVSQSVFSFQQPSLSLCRYF